MCPVPYIPNPKSYLFALSSTGELETYALGEPEILHAYPGDTQAYYPTCKITLEDDVIAHVTPRMDHYLLQFRSMSTALEHFNYIRENAAFDYLDISLQFAEKRAHQTLVQQVRTAMPSLKSRTYKGDPSLSGRSAMDRTVFYDDKKKVISIADDTKTAQTHNVPVQSSVRAWAIGGYAQVLRELLVTACHLPPSLSDHQSRIGTYSHKKLNRSRLLKQTGIVVNDVKQSFYMESSPLSATLKRADVRIDGKRQHSFAELANSAMSGIPKLRGRKPSVSVQGCPEYGQTVYIGKRTSQSQWCIYEKSQQVGNMGFHKDVPVRCEYRYRPKKTDKYVPSHAAYMSAAEVICQSKLTIPIVTEFRRPRCEDGIEMLDVTKHLLGMG